MIETAEGTQIREHRSEIRDHVQLDSNMRTNIWSYRIENENISS